MRVLYYHGRGGDSRSVFAYMSQLLMILCAQLRLSFAKTPPRNVFPGVLFSVELLLQTDMKDRVLCFLERVGLVPRYESRVRPANLAPICIRIRLERDPRHASAGMQA